MVATLLLAGVFAAPLSSAALFAGRRHPRRVSGRLAATRRLLLALVGTAVLAAVVGGVLWLLGVPAGDRHRHRRAGRDEPGVAARHQEVERRRPPRLGAVGDAGTAVRSRTVHFGQYRYRRADRWPAHRRYPHGRLDDRAPDGRAGHDALTLSGLARA